MCKDHPLKVYHILDSRWLDVNGEWSGRLRDSAQQQDSKALLESKKVCVYTYSRVWATSPFRGKSSISGKQWGEHCTLTAVLMAKVDFQQLTAPHTRYLYLEAQGYLLCIFLLQPQLSAPASRGSDPHLQHGAWAEHKRTYARWSTKLCSIIS